MSALWACCSPRWVRSSVGVAVRRPERVSGLTKISGGTPVLTAQGYVVAAALMLLFSIINVMGVR